MKHLLWACLLTSCSSIVTPVSILCGQSVVNSPGVDSTPSLQACFDSGASTINLVNGTYDIKSTLYIHRSITIQTYGVISGPACLEPGSENCAILQADPLSKNSAIITSSSGITIALNYIALDGNKAARRANYTNKDWINGMAYNALILDCNNCSFTGFTSINAAQGTGFGFIGPNAVFENDVFRDNGYGLPNYTTDSAWSDGLTLGSAPNVIVRNSKFINNSDVNLVIGNAPGALIENNVIGNTGNFAFAGFMMNTFARASLKDFTGAQIRNNTISCPNGACGIGIMIGPNFWDHTLPPVTNGSVYDNTVSGAIYGIMIDGALNTSVYQNTVSNWNKYSSYGCVSAAVSDTIADNNIHDNSPALVIGDYSLCGPNTLPIMTLEQ